MSGKKSEYGLIFKLLAALVIGAIVGRNVDDDGTACFNYYLKGCAKGGNGKDRYAMGNDGGSVEDGKKDYFASSFTSLTVGMSSTAGEYGTGQIRKISHNGSEIMYKRTLTGTSVDASTVNFLENERDKNLIFVLFS